MRIPQLALAVAGTLMCTGCSDMISLHPFVTDGEAVPDARRFYDVNLRRGCYTPELVRELLALADAVKMNEGLRKRALAVPLGDARILDLTPADEDAFQIAAHTPLRVWLEGATLRMAFLDSKWLRDHASAELAVEQMGDRLLIMSPQENVTRFLMTYGGDERAYGKITELTRQ